MVGLLGCALGRCSTSLSAIVFAALLSVPIYAAEAEEELMDLDLNLNAMGMSSVHHTHIGGEWMVGYQFMTMGMNGNRDGTSRVSTGDVLSAFPVAPTAMDMNVHMVSLMYAATDRLAAMVMCRT